MEGRNPLPQDSVTDVSLNPPAEAAIFADGRPQVSSSASRCCACYRLDVPEHALSLTTIARGGQLFRVCRLCYLLAEVRDLSTGGGVPADLLAHTEGQLQELYTLLRASLEARLQVQWQP